MYLILAALVEHFDFQFQGAKAEAFECVNDLIAIGTRGKDLLEANVSIREG
jgi:hypothetical protein